MQRKHATVLARARRAVDGAPPVATRAAVEVVTAGCAFCSWSVRAPLEQAREAFARHVCSGR